MSEVLQDLFLNPLLFNTDTNYLGEGVEWMLVKRTDDTKLGGIG